MPGPRVTLYTAAGCHLCDTAKQALAQLAGTAEFDLHEVDITGVPELEAAHREWLPVVEIEGERAFVYYVRPDEFLARLARHEVGTS